MKARLQNNTLFKDMSMAKIVYCQISLKSLYAQYNNNVLSKNLRYHVPGGGIDKAIEDTIRDYPEDFWFKNNGITIICSSFRLDGKEVKLKDFSIINGGQTTYMIHKSKNVSEELNFYLPCKIII